MCTVEVVQNLACCCWCKKSATIGISCKERETAALQKLHSDQTGGGGWLERFISAREEASNTLRPFNQPMPAAELNRNEAQTSAVSSDCKIQMLKRLCMPRQSENYAELGTGFIFVCAKQTKKRKILVFIK